MNEDSHVTSNPIHEHCTLGIAYERDPPINLPQITIQYMFTQLWTVNSVYFVDEVNTDVTAKISYNQC